MNDLQEQQPLPARIASRHNLALIIETMQASGIDEITARFNGEGDNGMVEEIITSPPDIPLTQRIIEGLQTISGGPPYSPDAERTALGPMDLDDAIDRYCMDYLFLEHSGWELDDGSFGAFKITPAGAEIDFYTRHIEHESGGDTPQSSPLDAGGGLPEPSPQGDGSATG